MFGLFPETSALVYTALRGLLAVVIALITLRRQAPLALLLGQTLSDAACVLFLVAYLDYDIRDVAKFFAPVLLIYVILWEWYSWRGQDGEDEGLDDASGEVVGEIVQSAAAPLAAGAARLAYELLAIVPPVIAGAFLVFELLYPRQWPFPNQPAALRCDPVTLASGDRVTLRMMVPHGGELGVHTPDGRFLYVVDYAAANTPVKERFEWQPRLTLSTRTTSARERPNARPERVFSDTGTYTFRVSGLGEVSASLICRVRYVGQG